jgi:DNA topoisomerase-1
MKLVVVESPTKAKTLSKFLGDGFEAVSSMGHVRDLPRSELGVDVEGNFTPQYAIVKGKNKVVQEIKKAAKKADTLFLATDPDREGEAIAWHIAQVLEDHMPPMKRVVFHEITETAVKEAFKHPREIDLKLVDSQQGRRVLDRLVGYKLSPLLWKKVRYGLSAGRVQSVAVRLIVEREREREKFHPSEYWTIGAELRGSKDAETHGKFKAELDSISGKPLATKEKIDLFDGDYEMVSTSVGSEEKAGELVGQLQNEKFVVEKVESRDQKRNPYPPFTTSTMQRAAVNYLGFSARRTMRAAQRLYEAGLITYHRTDSTALADRALKEFRDFIGSEYGSKYLPETAIRYKTKVRLAQEAHEAIRPTKIEVRAESLELRGDEKKLYELIWKRAVSCQMAPAILALTRVNIKAKDCIFKANGSQIKFDGFLRALGKAQETILPPLKEGEALDLISLDPKQHFTSPPPRYTEASLIKSLEEKGIGRPSTYAPIISTIQDRGYVSKEGKQIRPEDIGTVVNDLLVAYFPKVVDLSFTAKMEEDLDSVAKGEQDWVPMVREFYRPFADDLEEAEKNIEKSSITTLEETDEKCPDCGKPLVIKLGKYGRFYSCSGFPECKFTKPYIEKIGMRCPDCKDGEVIVKRTRRGKIFYGCSRYPKCKFASWKDPRKEKEEGEDGGKSLSG